MNDNVIVTVILPVGLVKKMTGPWYLLKKQESDQVRAAMQHSISWLPKSEPQESLFPDQEESP